MIWNLLSSSVDAPKDNKSFWIMLVVIGVVLIGMMAYSYYTNKKRRKAAEDKLNSIRVGDRVKTIGGICGVIVEIDEDENTFVLETGINNSGNFIKFDKIAIYQSSHPEGAEEKAEEVASEEPEKVEEAISETAEKEAEEKADKE